ncbi:hypothetical protein TNCV_4932401 [Trichonephila clavipes]|nr:hypothetical protein TNCV_4932401 [Trichonephila clavipes]
MQFNAQHRVQLMKTVSGYRIHRQKSGQSHPRATMAREDHHFSIIASGIRDATASRLSRELNAAMGTRVS